MLKMLIREGKTKKILSSENSGELLMEFKDSITAFNNVRKENISGKGAVCAKITEILFNLLNENKITTHYIKTENQNTHRVKETTPIPLEVVVRNYAAGSIVKNLNIPKGKQLNPEIIEFYYKSDELNDPLVNDDHILALNLVDNFEKINALKLIISKVNAILLGYFNSCGLLLVDLKVEFGFDNQGNLVLIDELSPDNFRIWEKSTMESMDKDLFRNNSGDVLNSYTKLLEKLQNAKQTHVNKHSKALVKIGLKPDIYDPQGKAITESLKNLGYKGVKEIRTGKTVEITFNSMDYATSKGFVENLCEDLLVNPVVESSSIEIMEI